ncbi:MAG: heparinase II/III family protein [Planctomycetes bacterium]|nr:heparinase II/III family protein [Planctomycetota bacterium]
MIPQITAGHPRLYLTSRELPAFRKMSQGPRRRYRALLLKKLEPHIASSAAVRGGLTTNPEYNALALGQAWRLTGADRYGRAARWLLEALEYCAHEKPTGYDTWGVVAEAAAVLYDWLHDYWRRKDLEEHAARAALYCARRALDEALRVYIVDDWHNYSLGLQAGALAGALAVGLDHPKLEDGALLRTLHALHFTGLTCDEMFLQDAYKLPKTVRCLDAALRSGGGAGFAGHTEATGAYHSVDGWDLVKMGSFWSSATRPQQRNRPNLVWPELVLAGTSLLHFMRPDGCNLVLGDSTTFSTTRGTRVANILLHLHARTPRPEFAAFLRAYGQSAEGPYPIHLLLHANHDSMPGGKGPDRRGLQALRAQPLSVLHDPIAVLRSSWKEDGTVVTFRCGRHGGWHNHLDHNSFTIYRGGALAIDSGGIDYTTPHRPEYAMRTLAHNAILVRDPAEPHWLGKHGLKTVNDGGQRLVVNAYAPPNRFTGAPHAVLCEERRARFADEFDMGHYAAFAPGAKADYLAGDATRAYTYPWLGVGDNPARRVEECVRQMLFLKPDLLVVFDRVEATRARFEKTWLLHSMGAPAYFANGRKRAAARGIHALPPEGPFEFAHERGRMTVWPLLPLARKVRAVGCKGFESWVDHAVVNAASGVKGVNYPAPKGQAETGAWRIEVSPKAQAVRDCFLTVIHAGLKREQPARDVIRCAARVEDGIVGLRIFRKSHGAWLPWASARFRAAGPLEAEYHFQGEEAHNTAPAPERVPKARGA